MYEASKHRAAANPFRRYSEGSDALGVTLSDKDVVLIDDVLSVGHEVTVYAPRNH